MSKLYPDIYVLCDSREQSALLSNHKTESAIVKGKSFISDYDREELYKLSIQRPRIFHVYEYFSLRGAVVEIGKLDRCDYRITGTQNGYDVDLGVEYKTISDLAGSMEELRWKLWESHSHYDAVSLCIEGKVDFEKRDWFHFVSMPGTDSTLRADYYQAMLASWSGVGVHVRQFDRLDQFGPTLAGLIDYTSKPVHSSVEFRDVSDKGILLKMLLQIPGIGTNAVEKLFKRMPEITIVSLVNSSPEELQRCLGKVTGQLVWDTLHGARR